MPPKRGDHTRLLSMRITSLFALAILVAGPASASTYQALCPNDPCTISLDANGISSPTGFIPTVFGDD